MSKSKEKLINVLKKGAELLRKEGQTEVTEALEQLIAEHLNAADEEAVENQLKYHIGRVITLESENLFDEIQEVCDEEPSVHVYTASGHMMLSSLKEALQFEPPPDMLDYKGLMQDVIRESALNIIGHIVKILQETDANTPTKH